MAMTTHQRQILDDVVDRLAPISGIAAIVLGGSHARGRARPDSDLDVGLYYREADPFGVDELARAAKELAGPDAVVTGFGEWGPWVDGGAWLTVRGQRVDLLYRSLDRCERVLADARRGRYEIHYGQQPPFGFFSPVYLGELCCAVPLRDDAGALAPLRRAAAGYPDALRRAVVQNCLWGAEFGLAAFAPKFAANRDAYNVAGCLTRFCYFLVLALFALNRAYPVNDKTVLPEIGEFALAPAGFGTRVNRLFARLGTSPQALGRALATVRELHDEVVALAGDLYRPNRTP